MGDMGWYEVTAGELSNTVSYNVYSKKLPAHSYYIIS